MGPRTQHVETILSGFIPYLESLDGVKDVRLTKSIPISEQQLLNWESNHGTHLPADLKAFYNATNGIGITWTSTIFSNNEMIGKIDINSIELLQEYATNIDRKTEYLKPLHGTKAFVLEELNPFGFVCLVYMDKSPQIWFHTTPQQQWFYLSDSFSGYFRLSLSCLGIRGWQMGLSSLGMSSWTNNWFGFYCPEISSLVRYHAAKIKYKKNDSARVESKPTSIFQLDKILKTIHLVESGQANIHEKRPTSSFKRV